MSAYLIDPAVVRRSTARITVCDVGGFNNRAGLCIGSQLSNVHRTRTSPTTGTPIEAFARGLAQRVELDRPDAVVISAAGPITEDGVEFTNVGLKIMMDEVRAIVHSVRRSAEVIMGNDAKCGAAGLMVLPPAQIRQFNGPDRDLWSYDDVTVMILGTGQGIAKIHGRLVKQSEWGHLWARRCSNSHVDEWMDRRFEGAVESEHFVSGMGLVLIAQALIESSGSDGSDAARMLAGVDAHGQAKFIAKEAQKHKGNWVFVEALRIFREQLGYTISALATGMDPIVIAGMPFSGDINYMFAGGANGSSPLRAAMLRRKAVLSVAQQAPVYGVELSHDPSKDEFPLLGAGAIGAMALAA